MRCAVVGAGFAGLAVCYYLVERGYDVVLFDKEGVAAGASGVPMEWSILIQIKRGSL